MRIQVSTEIDRPIEEVFQFQGPAHYQNHPRWDPTVTSLEPVGGGPIGLGSRFVMSRQMMGRPQTHTFEFVEWERPNRLAIEARSPGFHLRITSVAQSLAADKTLLTLAGEARMGGPRALLAPLMKKKLTRDSAANLARIKAMVESGEGR
ncbi:MAG: SRPBCC family protein [Candidatus Dormibacteria bacterium]